MIKVKHKLILSAFLLLGCTGCTMNGFLFRSSGNYGPSATSGTYFIGKPYQIKGVWYAPAENDSYSEKGLAAWYTRAGNDKITTNGEVFDDAQFTAAHKTLPLPSLVRVTNLENGNTAIVRVNDRGPMVNNRLMDVSRRTAEALEFPATGTTLIQVDILPEESAQLKKALAAEGRLESGDAVVPPPEQTARQPLYESSDPTLIPVYDGKKPAVAPPAADGFYIQFGAFAQEENARRLQDSLSAVEAVGISPKAQGGKTLYRVRSGPFETKEQAQTALDNLVKEGYSQISIIVKE